MDQSKPPLSCADCGVVKCDRCAGEYPPFCLTTGMPVEEEETLLALYALEENRAIMSQAAQVEYEGYCRLTRVEETIQFARRMGYRRIGIATCAGLIRESRTLARVLRKNGFEVYAVVCKAGAIDKTRVGIDERCQAIGAHMCNPIFQARQLARAGTQFNIVMGLCVGHDSLFYKYSHTVTTTMVVKDRVTMHNPAATLYGAESYYKKKLIPVGDAPV